MKRQPKTLQVGDRVRVGKERGVVFELPDPSVSGGRGITVSFPGEDLPCICDPRVVMFVSRPRKPKPLDPHTLRWASRRTKAEARKNHDVGDHAYAAGYADAGHDLLVMARDIERKAKGKR